MSYLLFFTVLSACLFYAGYYVRRNQKQAARDLGTFEISDLDDRINDDTPIIM